MFSVTAIGDMKTMKQIRIVAMIVAGLCSPLTFAEWVEVGRSADGAVIYSDPAMIKQRGKLTKAWFLIDHATVQKGIDGSYRSSKGQWEIDCAESTSRQLSQAIYSDPMAGGSTVWSGVLNRGLEPVVPGSISESAFAAACQ